MRTAVAIAGIVLAGLVGPAAAQAGAFSDSAQSCYGRTSSQPFLRWLDPLRYTLIPRGNFEQGTNGWTLTGGAAVVSGNESFYLSGPGTRSLYLPSGSSATTPAVCIETLDAVARYVAKNRSTTLLSTLSVEVLFEDPLTGKVRALPAGVHTGGSSWHPSLPALAVLDLLAPVLGKNGQIAVAFRFKPVGLNARWQIDDVYVDPFIQR